MDDDGWATGIEMGSLAAEHSSARLSFIDYNVFVGKCGKIFGRRLTHMNLLFLTIF